MRHDSSIPYDTHNGTRAAVKDTLGTFWSSVFKDQDFVDATLASKVLAASQRYIDVMEALSLRDHNGMPTFHREHWHPMIVKLSERNTGRGIAIGMLDTPIIGAQSSPGVYLSGEVFTVGGNAEYSKVNTYPITAFDGCNLVGVKTCICDSIQSPEHILVQDRDFSVCDGVFVVRKEQDPFDVGGYRVVDDGDDSVAVLWLCDAEFDTNNVGDFLAYPLGFDVKSTDQARKILSALWDVLVYGVAPTHLNRAIGALFDVPTVESDSVVESISTADSTGLVDVVTSDKVYCILEAKRNSAVTVGATLRKGDFLTTDVHVYHSLSADELDGLVDTGTLGSLYLPPGSVYGVSGTVVLENRESTLETGGWFKLNSGDTVDSPFWASVISRTTLTERQTMFSSLADGGTTVNPMKAIGYLAMANTILVVSSCGLCKDRCAGVTFPMLGRLVPSYASLMVVQRIETSDSSDLSSLAETVEAKVVNTFSTIAETAMAASDSVAFTFVPVAETEV